MGSPSKRHRLGLLRRESRLILALTSLCLPAFAVWTLHHNVLLRDPRVAPTSPADEKQKPESSRPSAFVARSNREVSGDEEIPPEERVLEGISEESIPQASELYKVWSRLYGLEDPMPPQAVLSPQAQSLRVPGAPHLEECTVVGEAGEQREVHGGLKEGRSGAGFPPWTCARPSGEESMEEDGEAEEEEGVGGGDERARASRTASHEGGTGPPGGDSANGSEWWSRPELEDVSFCRKPEPPWVLGSDADNLPLTRVAQRDLWVRQFPRDCSHPGLRFLLVDWRQSSWHGLGSQLHVMSAALSFAHASNRILVPTPHTFHRANHAGCDRVGQRGSLDCYFAPLTSAECTDVARALYRNASIEEVEPVDTDLHAMRNKTRVLRLSRDFRLTHFFLEATASEELGSPWLELHQVSPFEILGYTIENYSMPHAKATWFRSQAIRFMLRRPTPYLCHIMNGVRHEAYGHMVAERVAASMRAQRALLQGQIPGADVPQEEMEQMVLGASAVGLPLELTSDWRFPREPYMPRPIMSIHVRQGDKAREMELFSFQSYMWLAERVRLLVPDIQFVWLSTEMEDVIAESRSFTTWTFFHSRMKRQSGETSMFEYLNEVGLEHGVGQSFANLMIGAQCDYFVGVLGSNWNRLLNELRMTGGRVSASYFALNTDEW